MGILRRILEHPWILVKKIVSREGKIHFRRWRIIETPWFNIYIHHVARSDEEKDPHDHPWWFASLILRGGYFEDVWTGDKYNHKINFPGSLVVRKTSQFHKLRLMGGAPAWTLVLTGPKNHFWGYKTEDGWVDHVTYRQMKDASRPDVAAR
jgi:hypothetical protein